VDASVFWDSGYGSLPRFCDIHATSSKGVFLVAQKKKKTSKGVFLLYYEI